MHMQNHGRTNHPETTPGRVPAMSVDASPVLSVDFVKIAWDARWLLVLGLLVGLAAGYFHYTHAPPMYRSAAQVQIIDPIDKNLPVAEFDSGMASRSLEDEVLVLRSEHLLLRAIALGELTTAPEFEEFDAATIAATLSISDDLLVAPAVSSETTRVVLIQFDSLSRSTSQRVVQAIIDAYAQHLDEQYQHVGHETLELIETARSDVSEKLRRLDEEFSDFWKTSGLIYRGDSAMSVHRDNADKFLTQRQTLQMRRANLMSILNSAKRAIKAGQPLESVLIALRQSAMTNDNHRVDDPRNSWEIEKLKTTPIVSTAERLTQQTLLPLQLERETLVETYGRDHPALETIDKRIRVLKQMIGRVETSERQQRADLDAAMVAAESERGIITDPTEKLRADIRNAVKATSQQLAAVDEELAAITQAYESELEAATNESNIELRSQQLDRQRQRQQDLYDRIVARLDEINMMSGGGGLKLFPLNTAKPGYQVEPSLAKSLLMGGFAGWMLAACLALARDLSDRSYHGAGQIARHTRLPVIGHIPVIKPARVDPDGEFAGMDPRLCTFFKHRGSQAEAFRGIRTAVFFGSPAGGNQILQITSAVPSEGKTTVACNLAVTLAQSGRNVLLLDADLRRPNVDHVMGIDSALGTAWAIEQASRGDVDLNQCVGQAIVEAKMPNLSVMPAGDLADNPSELLSSAHFDRLLSVVRRKFDLVIIDSPPLLAVSDPANTAPRVDGVFLVVRLRKNIKPHVAQAVRMLESLEANTLGIIVNGVGSRAARGYGKSDTDDAYANNPAFQFGYGYGNIATLAGDKAFAKYYQPDEQRSKRRNGEATVV